MNPRSMKNPHTLLLTALLLTSAPSPAEETETTHPYTLPPSTRATLTPLPLPAGKPGSLTPTENGTLILFPKHPTTPAEKPILITPPRSPEKPLQLPPGSTSALSYSGYLYLGSPTAIHLIDKKGETRTLAQNPTTPPPSPHPQNPLSFALGPDARIYATTGDQGLTLTATDGSKIHLEDTGAVFRFELDGTRLEIVHRGLINPSGIAFTHLGDPYLIDTPAHTGDKPRLIRIIEEGDSGWISSYRTQDPSTTPWITQKLWETSNPSQPPHLLPASAHLTTSPVGLIYHPGTGFLGQETERFLLGDNTADPTTSGIISFGIKETRRGIQLLDPHPIITGVNTSALALSPEGTLLLTDTLTQKLITLTPENPHLPEENTQAATLLTQDLDQRTSDSLTTLLNHPNSHLRLLAHIALTRKPDAIEAFRKALESPHPLTRIHAIQGLGILARRGPAPSPGAAFSPLPLKSLRQSAATLLTPLLTDPNPEIRLQTLRAIAEAPLSGDSLPISALLSDDSDRIRLAAALAIGKLKAIGQYSAIISFLAKNNHRNPHLTHAGTYALQHITTHPQQISVLASHESPSVRLAAVIALRRLNSLEVVRLLQDPDPLVQNEVIRTIVELRMTDAYPMLIELSETTTRDWPPTIHSLIETVKNPPH